MQWAACQMSDKDELDKLALEALERAFDQPSPQRTNWVQTTFADQAALMARVLELLDAEGSVGASLRTGGAREFLEDETRPERAGAYKITGLIGRGGMGAVYTAERDAGDFEHTVAVKIVRPGVLNEALIGRFENERQILASLNHPGIARLFDGGSLPDGSPYIVMELVDGVSISEWVRDKDLSLEERLSLFADVCGAVAHAHQNMIVHRDITPNNVLVTNSGEPKLIDFGIAKTQATDLNQLVTNNIESLTFTPGFAAPERLAGAPVNALSDIFSLGRLLVNMLDGMTLPDDVSAIIAKATRAEPNDRYATATALVDDIRAYLTGYPVEAQNGDAFYRFKKFFDRRKLAVSFGSAAAIGLISAFIVTTYQYVRAERALDRANQRFEQARELSRTLIFDAYDEFAKVEGTLEARTTLANLVSDYVDALAADPYAPSDILYDVGTMGNRLSNIYGGLGLANLGDTEKSGELLISASQALESLLEDEPSNTDAMAELAMIKRSISMQSLNYDFDTDRALGANSEVFELTERGVAIGDDNEQTLLRHFWSARTDRLHILSHLEEYDTALSELEVWRQELDEEMFERLGGGERIAAYFASQQGNMFIQMERHEEAIEPLTYARNFRLDTLKKTPNDTYQKVQLIVANNGLAEAHYELEAFDIAADFSEESVLLAREAIEDDPLDVGGAESLIFALNEYAKAQAGLKQDTSAQAAAQESVAVSRGLIRQFPGEPFYENLLARSLIALAEILTRSNQTITACASLAEARALTDKAVSDDEPNMALARRIKDMDEIAVLGGCS